MNSNYRSLLIWGVIALILIVSFSLFNGGGQRSGGREISYSEFLQKVESNELKNVTIQGQKLTGQTVDNRGVSTYAPYDPDLVEKLGNKGVNIKAIPESSGNNIFLNLLFSLLPVIIIVGAWIFFMRQMQSGSRGAMGFGKSKAKLLNEAQGRVTFKDVAGVEEAKQDLQEIVEFLREPQKFQRLGGRIPRGVLLVGPPGTGKTLLARSVAGEANVPFFTISGSDFVEMFVGVGASRVRDMFEQAKKNAPCIIFIDEIDAVGRHRGAGLGGGNDEREQTLNQLLVEMDGFEPNESIILIAATNRPDVLDPALLRPGRFDRQVVVPNPDVSGREQILKVHVRNVPLAPNVDLKVLARGTPGFSGADLMNLVNEAALMAASRNKRVVTMQEFEDAKDKVMMGAERRSTAMTQEEKELTAYHEAGHAIVALNVPVADPVHKATIVPRGRALGMVMQLPEGDRYSMSYRWMVSRLAIMMGGRVAEELKFGKENITSGAASDIEQATKLARAMITRWGFSDLLGNVAYGDNQDEVFLGHSVARTQNVSEETARMIDAEVRKLIDDAYTAATKILKTKKKEWFALAQGLLEYETLTGAEINEVIAGKPPSRTQKDENAALRVSSVPKTGARVNFDDIKDEDTKADKTGHEKASGALLEAEKVEKKTIKSRDAKSSVSESKPAKSQGASQSASRATSQETGKKVSSTKNVAKAENRSKAKSSHEKKSDASEHDKGQEESSNDT
ncbi:ATP-dependent zinc metalloprotease FtsH [Bartonella rattaustraliani]|uniref:ATP-dependent zinc metalloprotease FtsH n=1 Tax=Bartonella rattaustraliani TaxID=481139 RepID=UPI0002D53A4B|nr:ATP-dependent zinc metalloprotease FtsH [Bartonella rattaustraliani]